ncbi:unnamed protein product [Musa banksii]
MCRDRKTMTGYRWVACTQTFVAATGCEWELSAKQSIGPELAHRRCRMIDAEKAKSKRFGLHDWGVQPTRVESPSAAPLISSSSGGGGRVHLWP